MTSACGPKTTLFFINSFVFILGITLLGVGVYIKVDTKYTILNDMFNYDRIGDAGSRHSKLLNLDSVSVLLIIIGAVMTVMSLIGIFGACCENKCLVTLYCIVISLIFVSLMCISITLFVFKYAYQKDVISDFKKTISDEIKLRYEGEQNNPDSFTFVANVFMITFECCGVFNYKDFDNSVSWNKTVGNGLSATAPVACCKFSKDQRNLAITGEFPQLTDYTCATKPTEQNSNYLKGCLTEANDYLVKIVLAALIVSTIIGFLLLLATTHSCYLCCILTNRTDSYDYKKGYRRYQQYREF